MPPAPAMIRLENLGRQVLHFPVVEMRDTRTGKTPVERYRVVIGDREDRQRSVPREDGTMATEVNTTTVPANAWDTQWSPHIGADGRPVNSEIYEPAPVVNLTAKQFVGEVFRPGSTNRRILDQLVEDGVIRLEESSPGSLKRYEQKLPTADASDASAEVQPEA